jgi:hypothetical protein
MRNQKKRKWTVFFIIKSVDDSIDELITMVNEIRSLEFTKAISIVLCIHMVKENLDALLSGDASRIARKGSKKTFTTVFYTIVPAPKSERFLNRLEPIYENPEFDITNEDHLANYFKKEVLNKHRAKRYILFTWDHGRAYGMFAENPNTTGNVTQPIDMTGTIEIHQQEGEKILTMEELANAIQWVFEEKKVDIVIMMNCIMQFIDVGYALRDSVKYLVASEIAMDYNGYNYPYIFQLLIDNPKISTKKLAKNVVTSFSTKVFPTVQMGRYQKSSGAIFSNDLSYYTLLANLIDRLSDCLIAQLPHARLDILRAKKNSIIDHSYQLLDLYTFLEYLEEYGLLQRDTVLASLILSIKQLIIFKSYIGQSFSSDSGLSKFHPTGLSIFFPSLIVPDKAELPGLQQTAFYNNTKWKNLLILCQEFQ